MLRAAVGVRVVEKYPNVTFNNPQGVGTGRVRRRQLR